MPETTRHRSSAGRCLGTVVKLWRYPVKSMLGERCSYLDLDARGVVGDRVFAVADADGKLGSGKSTRRFRQIDGLLGFRAAYQGDSPVITCPDGRRLPGADTRVDAVLSELLGHGVTLVREQEVPHLDAAPVHLLTTASLAWLRTALPDAEVDERRFRPNLLIDVAGDTRIEEHWLDETLSIGPEVRLRISDVTERCRMVTLPQDDLPGDSRVLERIGRTADLCFGVYADVVSPGRLRRGDEIFGDGA